MFEKSEQLGTTNTPSRGGETGCDGITAFNPLSHIIILAKLYAKYDVSIVFAKYIGPN